MRSCGTCHSGTRLSDGQAHDVATGGAFVTPPLTSFRQRAPYLHDGCAETARDVFGICGGVAHQLSFNEGELTDLVAYLQTL